MQPGNRRRNDSQDGGAASGRARPEGMPLEVAHHSRAPKQMDQKRDKLPEQKPVTDEAEQPKPPSKTRVFLKRLIAVLLLGVALGMAYVFLLLGEPDGAADAKTAVREETIRVPMAAVEAQGNVDLSAATAAFGKSVLILYGNPIPLQKVTLYDTAFQGGYARRAVLVYAFADGQTVTLESIRPTSAAALLGKSDSSLFVGSIYSLAGLDAARMDSTDSVCIFAKSEEAVYAITCPTSHMADLGLLVKQTTLLEPTVENP